MAMAYLMTSQFFQLSLAVSNHVTDGNGSFGDYHEDAASADLASQRRDFDTASTGNIRIWKDYTTRGKQKLVTAFSSIQGHKPGVRSFSAVVDWQQQSGYLD